MHAASVWDFIILVAVEMLKKYFITFNGICCIESEVVDLTSKTLYLNPKLAYKSNLKVRQQF